MADQREPALPTACRSREGLCPAQAASRSPKRRGEPLDIAQEPQNPETRVPDRRGGGRGRRRGDDAALSFLQGCPVRLHRGRDDVALVGEETHTHGGNP